MTAVVYSEEYGDHETGNHPENKERVRFIINAIKESGRIDENDIFRPEMAGEADLERVHTHQHVENIRTFCQKGGGYWDYDTFASPKTYQIAKLAAGGAIKAAELVLNGQKSAYAVVRPPGHHATKDRAMGFCFFNNLAITLEYLRETHRLKKFMIVDFDVHYGNGTAEMFYHDPRVLYISIHQDPRTIFPGTGFIEEMGSDEGKGYNLNIPMPPGSSTADYIYILEKILKPAAEEFKADFYMADVGFDGHEDDPLSSICLDDDFFQWIGAELMDIAGSLVLILEGGYNLEALSRCNLKLINGLKEHKTIKEIPSPYENLRVNRRTKDIFKEIKEVFSPFFEF